MTNLPEDALQGFADDYILTRKAVEQITSLSRATIYRLIAAKEFPKPIKISSNRVGWPARVIRDWLRSR